MMQLSEITYTIRTRIQETISIEDAGLALGRQLLRTHKPKYQTTFRAVHLQFAMVQNNNYFQIDNISTETHQNKKIHVEV
jgi:hypothetical protein